MATITRDQIDMLFASSKRTDTKMGAKTTVVHLTLPSGFELVEASSCVDPVNYNHDIGVSVCTRRLQDRLWLLLGYILQNGQTGGIDFLVACGDGDRIQA